MEKHKQYGIMWTATSMVMLIPVFLGVPLFLFPFAMHAHNAYKCFTDPKYADNFLSVEQARENREKFFSRKKDDEDDDY